MVICVSITNCLKEHNWLFRTDECLGRGSYGEVIGVEHKVDGSRYAVKKLDAVGENVAETEIEEAKRMCRMLHTNICRYYNAWQEGGFVHIRMELCDKDLCSWIKWRNDLLFEIVPGPQENIKRLLEDSWVDLSDLPTDRSGRSLPSSQQTWFKSVKARGTNDFLKGLLKGVRYLHEVHRLAHQDLHLKNILLKINYPQNAVTAKICDFGSATKRSKSFDSADSFDSWQDLESIGKIMTRMYYPLHGEEDSAANLLSALQKSSRNHDRELSPDFGKVWPDQTSWIRRLLSRDEAKPSASQMLDEGMRSSRPSFPSEKYRKGLEDGQRRDSSVIS